MIYSLRFIEGPKRVNTGTHFGNLAAVRREVLESAREMIADQLRRGRRVPSGCFFEIADMQDKVIERLPLESIVFQPAP